MAVVSSLLMALLEIFGVVLHLYIWVLIISAVLSWLIAFEIVNPRSRFVHTLLDISYRLTEPALRPIRRFLPPMRGIDLSPLILIFILMFLQSFLGHLFMNLAMGNG